MKKGKFKKILKFAAAVAAFAMIAGLLYFANGLLGNPVSYLLAKSAAEKYIEENYADEGYVLRDVSYSFKDIRYHAHIEKPNSEDCRFSVGYGWFGDMIYDSYESEVLSGFSTFRRLDSDYREITDKVLTSPMFPYERSTSYGSLEFDIKSKQDYALSSSMLVPDGLYDMGELGSKAGRLTIYVYNKGKADPEGAAEILLEIKKLMDMGGVRFHAVDLVIYDCDAEEKFGEEYRIENFLYTDIYEEGLADRAEKNCRKTSSYYAEQDKLKAAELDADAQQ